MAKLIFSKGTTSYQLERGASYNSVKRRESRQVSISTPSGFSIYQNLSRAPYVFFDIELTLAPLADLNKINSFMELVNWGETTFSFTDWRGDTHPYARFVNVDFVESEEYSGYFNISVQIKAERTAAGGAS